MTSLFTGILLALCSIASSQETNTCDCRANSTGLVRLVNGEHPAQGNVEVRQSLTSPWGSICDNGWDINDAKVVCRQLGYLDALAATVQSSFGSGSGSIWLDSVQCTGNENQITECTRSRWGVTNSRCRQYATTSWNIFGVAGVVCKERSEDDVDLKLVGNTTEGQGNVLVGFRGVWGHVCDTFWDTQDATVVCRQLGYKRAAIATGGTTFGNTVVSKIWLENVQCFGGEQKLKDCQHSTWGYLKRSCGRAGVVCDDGSGNYNLTIRLVGGQTQASGRVDVKINNVWGTVCDSGWDINDAHVVCRMLGYPTALAATLRSSFVQTAGKFWLANVACLGTEENIGQCQNRPYSYCSHSREAGVICREMNDAKILVRLSGGVNQSHGLVEVGLNGDWRGVCGTNWDIRDARVVCRMLGYPMAVAAVVGREIDSYHGSGRQWMDNVQCRGTEATIDKCAHNAWGAVSSSCSYRTGAGVVCRESNETTHIQVRLADGVPNPMHTGQVELQYHGLWGTVCGSNWDIREAQVVCRQLGYDKAVAATHYSAFGESTGHIWAQSFDCSGEESRLDECRFAVSTISTTCGNHAEDVGVVCGGNLSIRLDGGNGYSTGRVQVGFNNQLWGSICDSPWSNEDATVACKMLGFERGLRTPGSTFGQGLLHIWSRGIRCNGDERSLLDCVNNGWGVRTSYTCSNTYRASVICLGNHSSPEIRLVGGNGNSDGYVEIGFNGTWGKVCPTNWDISDAQVVCRMLGYQHALAATGGAAFANSLISRYWITNVNCMGEEQSILDCQLSSWGGVSCSGSSTAGVICADTNQTINIRLVGGKDASQGRIEVGLDGIWGTVCHYSWDIHDAEVVCRQLGYKGAMAATLGSSFGPGTGRIWATNFACKGEEQSLLDCSHSLWGETGSCDHSSDAGVVCQTGKMTESDIEIKLERAEGDPVFSGRVLVGLNGAWGTICGEWGWDLRDAHVVCRQLGYFGAVSATNDVKHGLWSGRVWLRSLSCTGKEKSLLNCSNDGWGDFQSTNRRCNLYRMASVTCNGTLFKPPNIESRNLKGQFIRLNSNRFTVPLWLTADSSSSLNRTTFLCYQLPLIPFNSIVNLFSSPQLSINAQYIFHSGQFQISSIGILVGGPDGNMTSLTIHGNQCRLEINGQKQMYGSYIGPLVTVQLQTHNSTLSHVWKIFSHRNFSILNAICTRSSTWKSHADTLDLLIPVYLNEWNSHGLIGQFWNVLAEVTPPDCDDYTLFSLAPLYKVLLPINNRKDRSFHSFPATLHISPWDISGPGPCLYTSHKESSIISGNVEDYVLPDLLAGEFHYSKFTPK